MKRDLDSEQFFTSPENVDFCMSKLGDLSGFTSIIEPSAGDGAFSKRVKNCIAMDLHPMSPEIKEQDFLQYNPGLKTLGKNVLTFGNPPFGRQSSLAIKFINHEATYSNVIAFVLAKSFKKESMINRLNKHVFLRDVYDLPSNSFYFGNENFDIPCAFFIFDVKEIERPPVKVYKTDDFVFLKSIDGADNSIRRVGFYAGKVEDLNVSSSSHYYVAWKDPDAKQIFTQISFEHNNTVGARSLSKNEIVKMYVLKKEEINGTTKNRV